MNKDLKSEFYYFFEFFEKALKRIQDLTLKGREYHDDAVFLSCIYLDALATFRYGGNKTGFIHFLQNYSSENCKKYYNLLSRWMLANPLLDRRGRIKKIKGKGKTKRLYYPSDVLRRLGKAGDYKMDEEITVDEVCRRLRFLDKSEINKFSIAGYFYYFNRCFGLHNAQLIHGWTSIRRGDPFYMSSSKTWELVIPLNFTLDTLESCIKSFNDEVIQILDEKEFGKINKYAFVRKVYGVKNEFIENYLFLQRRGAWVSQIEPGS